MASIALVVGVGLLVFYVEEAPKLPPSVRNQVYYVVLFPLAIACAVALFGATRSYARLTAKQPGIVLELGGPAVLFVLILWGGLKLVPPPGDTFDLTVRAHSADGSVPVIKSGSVTLELDDNRLTKPLAPEGEADFKGVPAKFWGTTIGILPQVDGYEEKWQERKVEGNSLDVPLERIRPRPITYRGFVQDEQGSPLSGVQVTSPDCDQQSSTNAKGTFTLQVSVIPEARCHIVFSKDGYTPYNTDVAIHAEPHDRFLLRRKE
jgi:hypothetical protein